MRTLAALFLALSCVASAQNISAVNNPLVYRVGGGVTPPKVLKSPEPNYPRSARDQHVEGKVVLFTIVGVDGRTHDTRVERSGGEDFDKEAIKAVGKWRFQPSTKDGVPVAVQINIEVSFHLY